MNWRALLPACALAALLDSALAVDPRERTDSGQFTIYCDDANARRQAAGLAVKTRDEVLALLDESNSWRHPIVVTIDLFAPPHAASRPITSTIVETVVGMKVTIVARIGHEPVDVNLQEHLIRAVLLEYMYRREGVKAGTTYAEPPWWLVLGTMEMIRHRETGVEPRFFRTLIETNKLPPIESFLAERPDELGPTALAVDRALAMALVQLLIEQPGGRQHLASLVRRWPEASGDALGALGREFPGLSGGAPALQKWWTLNLARFAATDRVESLSPEDTDRQLGALLEFEVAQKDGPPRRFAIADFPSFLKLPASRAVLAGQHTALISLSSRSNVLLRPALEQYEECFALLAKGKSGGLRERLERAARLRTAVVRRATEIADYLNWFEATQSGTRSNAFDNYLRTANEVLEQEKSYRDPIARYLDELEKAL